MDVYVSIAKYSAVVICVHSLLQVVMGLDQVTMIPSLVHLMCVIYYLYYRSCIDACMYIAPCSL